MAIARAKTTSASTPGSFAPRHHASPGVGAALTPVSLGAESPALGRDAECEPWEEWDEPEPIAWHETYEADLAACADLTEARRRARDLAEQWHIEHAEWAEQFEDPETANGLCTDASEAFVAWARARGAAAEAVDLNNGGPHTVAVLDGVTVVDFTMRQFDPACDIPVVDDLANYVTGEWNVTDRYPVEPDYSTGTLPAADFARRFPPSLWAESWEDLDVLADEDVEEPADEDEWENQGAHFSWGGEHGWTVDEIAESLAAGNPMRRPVEIIEAHDGTWGVTDGHHRVVAALRVGAPIRYRLVGWPPQSQQQGQGQSGQQQGETP